MPLAPVIEHVDTKRLGVDEPFMLTAITRGVSPYFQQCELTFLSRQKIDIDKSVLQHRTYTKCLSDQGVRVVSLAADPYLPDAVFVEDAAIVLDEIAIIALMRVEKRRQEIDGVANALTRFRKIEFLRPPATLDGGDVMRVGRTLYVGLSTRTNQAAIDQLSEIVRPFDYRVQKIEVERCLHLKTGCSYLGQETVLANPSWINTEQLDGLSVLSVHSSEPWAANTLTVDGTTLVASNFPRTRRMLERNEFPTRALDISELQKAEAGLTCLSIIFKDENPL